MSSQARVRKHRRLKRYITNNITTESDTESCNDHNQIDESAIDVQLPSSSAGAIEPSSHDNDFHLPYKYCVQLSLVNDKKDIPIFLEDCNDNITDSSSGNSNLSYNDEPVSSVNDCSTESSDELSSNFNNENENEFKIATKYTDELVNGTMRSKLHAWALKNITTLTKSTIDDLLLVMRSENYDLPKSSKTLLKTSETKSNIMPMLSKKQTYGQYTYLSIKTNLEKIIDPSIYTEPNIVLLIGVDGAKVYNKTKNDMWPILGLVYNTNYDAKPFLIGLYYGDSKPHSVREFLQDLVLEINELTTNGIFIADIHYNFNVKAFVCDTPARAYLKQCKGHGGFYACERCTIKGATIQIIKRGGKRVFKRVYNEINCTERTDHSFRLKTQAEHHSVHESSPLIDISEFNMIKSFPLDAMHLLCNGIGKYILEKLTSTNNTPNNNYIGNNNVQLLQSSLDSIVKDITIEFQRKRFDLQDLVNMKATQFRLILLYFSALLFKPILSLDKYKHFLLLFTSLRILCSKELAVHHFQYAKHLLQTFVKLMPTYYGNNSVTITVHNLIHVADDVEFMEAPLFEYSAFAFENCIGFLKKLLKSRTKPVSQVVRRLHEMQQKNISSSHFPLIYVVKKRNNTPIVSIQKKILENVIYFSSVEVNHMTIKTSKPDNVCLMNNGDIIVVNNIFVETVRDNDINRIMIEGYSVTADEDVFDFPFSSKHIGIMYISQFGTNLKIYPLKDIRKKCILTTIYGKKVIITLLHL